MGLFGFLPDARRRRALGLAGRDRTVRGQAGRVQEGRGEAGQGQAGRGESGLGAGAGDEAYAGEADPGEAGRRGTATRRRLDRKNLARLALMVGAGGVAGPVLLMLGLKAASAGSVALWLNFEMVATLLLGALFFKESFGLAAVAGSLGAFAASVLLVLGEGPSGWASALLVLGATTAWAVDNHASALVDALSPAESTAVKGLAAGTVNVLLGLATGASLPPAGEILAALVLGFASYGLSIALYVRSAQGLGASRAQILFASSPFWGLCLAALLPVGGAMQARADAAVRVARVELPGGFHRTDIAAKAATAAYPG